MLVKNFDEVKTYIVYLYLEEDDVEVAKVDTKFLTDVTDNELNFGAPCKVHWARKPGNSPYKIPLGNRYLIPLVDGEDPSDLNKIALAINKKEIRPVNIIPDFNIDTARKEICDLKSRALSPKTSDEADNLTCDVGENRKSARKRLLKVDDEKPKAKKQIFVEVAARKKNWDRLVSSIKGLPQDAQDGSECESVDSNGENEDVRIISQRSAVVTASCAWCADYKARIARLETDLALGTGFAASRDEIMQLMSKLKGFIQAAQLSIPKTSAGGNECGNTARESLFIPQQIAQPVEKVIIQESEQSMADTIVSQGQLGALPASSSSCTAAPNAEPSRFSHNSFPISASIIAAAPKCSVTRFVAHIMDMVYPIEYLKTHKVTGQCGRPGKVLKTPMKHGDLQHIIEVALKQNLMDKHGRSATVDDVRQAIGSKFNNASKEQKKIY